MCSSFDKMQERYDSLIPEDFEKNSYKMDAEIEKIEEELFHTKIALRNLKRYVKERNSLIEFLDIVNHHMSEKEPNQFIIGNYLFFMSIILSNNGNDISFQKKGELS